jgi:hypothetical protein
MPLDEYGKYETVTWTKVHMSWELPEEEKFYFSQEIKEILVWLVDDLIMPSWYRNKETGKCIWWNASLWWNVPREFRDKFYSRFDIKQ